MGTERPDAQASDARAADLARGLYPHQVEGLAFLLGRRRSILADDMGLGKTRQSILALSHAEPDGPWLVVSPASVKHNWAREIAAVRPDDAVHIVGPAPVPEPAPDEASLGWVVVNYDLLSRHVDALLAHPWRGLVFDEAHYLKNHTSVRSKLSRRLVAETPGDPVVHALTGTPLTNRPRDLFPLLQLVDHSLGRSFFAFSKRYCAAERNDYGHWVSAGASNVEELAVQLHGIMLRRRKEEVLDLPPKVRTWIDTDIPDKARQHFNDAVRDFLGDGEHGPERDARGRRRGIGRLASARSELAVVKTRRTLEYVQGIVDQGEKVIVFSAFQKTRRPFEKHFCEQVVVITGETPVAERQALVDRFQNDDDVRVYFGQIQAGGTGVNLTAARQVVFNDLDWVPANHWQAEDRAYRIGQTGSVNVTYMVARDTVEEFVRTVLETKSRVIDDVVEGRALADDGDVMGELRRMLRRLESRFDALRRGDIDAEELEQVLQAAGEEYLQEQAAQMDAATRDRLVPVSHSAVRALAAVLRGPSRRLFRAVSSRDASKSYTLEVIGADVTCDCRGFEYRGACRHARDLKEALVAGDAIPADVEEIRPD
jgi:SWI/SNF-related matrix-associated actin-dependent regulator 1 of chromatin subfamily A